ncbi:DegT/DnrJ/EryC1/StrS family aminotransferase [Pelotomaculum propionicicum]|uniref:GDP-perosamine synthase n=1 Tax=Pelotomaculum propionicicum TaxID=258475 RepID=A0A4Y7RQR3_9FIRM|nr:DegT/DnrJ/EryC1/StrS family aminotransferase [Pelotomaculum propionicicum]TEB11059.1 GDP-perosamine synthase [Pelotomaculum propionicicum]
MIPVCKPSIGTEELKYVTDCVKSSWIGSMGTYIEEFENEFAKFCGTKYAVSTTSGTTALHLALASLGIGPGDEVILPTFTMAATLYAVIYTGAKPVLIDSEYSTLNIDTGLIESKINQRTKALLPVHIYGHPCDMDILAGIARKYRLYLVEDAAEAHGAEYKNKKAGSFGDIGCFSFYANKIITTGEGGMIVTNNEEIACKARILKNLGFSPEKRFYHVGLGYNYRMTNIEAAIGLAQLQKADRFISTRINNANKYNSILKDIDGIELPTEKAEVKNVYWMYGIRLSKDLPLTKDEMMQKLAQAGIETRSFFIPMHLQPAFKEWVGDEQYPVAEDGAQRGFYLPSSSDLTSEEIEYVCDSIYKIVKGSL